MNRWNKKIQEKMAAKRRKVEAKREALEEELTALNDAIRDLEAELAAGSDGEPVRASGSEYDRLLDQRERLQDKLDALETVVETVFDSEVWSEGFEMPEMPDISFEGFPFGERYESKLEEISEQQEDLRERIQEIEEQLDELDASLTEGEEMRPDARKRMEARRERLLARKERFELKLDLLAEKAERVTSRFERRARSRRWSQEPKPSARTAEQRNEERMRVLNLLQGGKISADDAAKLLEALDKPERRGGTGRRPRWIRIRVTDLDTDKPRVDLTLPLGIFRAGVRAGATISGVPGLSASELEELINSNEAGHIIDAVDEEDGERVEIFLE